ncbi:hypothetical protein E2C01_048446 [Portunus trituberculatus]|uniref:Uncharacterized protein n=1 Tax=Portunus trituberculatus TaxID=210409 RepID=A0A5B7GB17_PORTR|nr:hypothetical protein [Portunus trituberculatus]
MHLAGRPRPSSARHSLTPSLTPCVPTRSSRGAPAIGTHITWTRRQRRSLGRSGDERAEGRERNSGGNVSVIKAQQNSRQELQKHSLTFL